VVRSWPDSFRCVEGGEGSCVIADFTAPVQGRAPRASHQGTKVLQVS
jgi:hypothetical protein